MDFFSTLHQQLAALQQLLGNSTGSIPERLHQLSDDELALVSESAELMQRRAERLLHATAVVREQRANMRVHA